MSEAEAARAERALTRIRYLMWVLGVSGTAAAAWRKGWSWALGFLSGALLSVVNFHWLEQVAAGLASGRGPRRLRWAVLFGARYLAAGLAGYVIVKVFGLSPLAILAGLLVAAGAVLAEMVYELIHGRT